MSSRFVLIKDFPFFYSGKHPDIPELLCARCERIFVENSKVAQLARLNCTLVLFLKILVRGVYRNGFERIVDADSLIGAEDFTRTRLPRYGAPDRKQHVRRNHGRVLMQRITNTNLLRRVQRANHLSTPAQVLFVYAAPIVRVRVKKGCDTAQLFQRRELRPCHELRVDHDRAVGHRMSWCAPVQRAGTG